MLVHCLRHVPFESEAAIGLWADDRGHARTATDLYAGQPLPDPREVDFLVVMGGPMNIYEEAKFPWLAQEKAFLDAYIALNRPAVGVCLGAQLLADRLGGPVGRNPQGEIGWFPVECTPEGRDLPLLADLPSPFTAFHWHGDRFAIPPGAVRIAASEACDNQGFLQNRILGLQFHMESTPESIGLLLRHCADELTPGGPFIQDAVTIRKMCDNCATLHPLLDNLLDKLTAKPHS